MIYPRRHPSGAFKLLVHLMYGQYPYMNVRAGGVLELESVHKLARRMATDSRTVRKWLTYLEQQGYLGSLTQPTPRSALFKVRQPSNVFEV